MEIIIINEKKNKTLSFLINWSILTLITIVIIAIFVLFAYGIINFTRGRVDYKRVQQLTRENNIVQREIEYLESEIKSLHIAIDSLAERDSVLKPFAGLMPLKVVVNNTIEEKIEPNSGKGAGILSVYLDELLLRVEAQYATNKAIIDYLSAKAYLKNSIPSIAPVNGWFMRGFGYTLDPFTETVKMHEGVDIAAPVGTPIVAPADGVVEKVQNKKDFGVTIEIRHNQSLVTIYAHCQNPSVISGQKVKRGDIIGYVGTSGKITGPHLHYEIRIEGIPVDPLNYLIMSETTSNE